MEDKYGVKQLYSDWKKMLKEVKPDAVSICTPNGQHAPASIDSSNAGSQPAAIDTAEVVDADSSDRKAAGPVEQDLRMDQKPDRSAHSAEPLQAEFRQTHEPPQAVEEAPSADSQRQGSDV